MFENIEEVKEEDQEGPLHCKRPFQPKFIRELNSQNEKGRRNKKKLKEPPAISKAKLEKLEKVGLGGERVKSWKKLPETNRNGNRILGAWRNGQLDGDSEIYYSNGVVFKGTYQNGIKVKGYFKFLNGYEYIGHCLGNKFNGEGSLVFPSGKIISGEWKGYSLADKGKIEYPNGEVYYGDICNLKKHGKGYLFFTDGTKYVGQFQHGLINGYGTYFVNDQAESTGKWVNGELQDVLDLNSEMNNEHNHEVHELCDIIKSSKGISLQRRDIAEEEEEEEEKEDRCKQNLGQFSEKPERTHIRSNSRKAQTKTGNRRSVTMMKRPEKKLRFADNNQGVSFEDQILED